jgi:hypothetical protein
MRRLDRRTVLQTAGLGAGAAVAPGLLGKASAATRARQPAPAADELPLIGGPEFPIGLFWPPPPFETTLARYEEIADAGFTFLITGNYLFDQFIGRHALGFADQVGLKVLVANDPRVFPAGHHLTITDDRTVPSSLTTADATTWVRAAVEEYAAYESFVGFNVFDEPSQERFPTVGALTDILRQVRPDLLPYSNLWPGNGPSYAAFVQSYVDTVRPALISFDRYPILTSGVDLNYFDTWVIIRDAALRSGLPSWAFIQSVGYNGHRIPDASELAWQVNVSLAYGCKGIQYFTYWTPDPARGEGFTRALLTVDGKRTPLYGAARTLNRTWLRPVGKQLKPLVSESVQHANEDPLPPSTTPFTPGDYLSDVVGGAVIPGLFRAEPDDGTRWLLVTNRNPNNARSVRIDLNQDTVTAVARFAPARETYVRLGNPASVTVDLDAGAATLLRLSA